MQGYREMVFQGSSPVVRAFLAGLQEGRRWKGGILFCDDYGVEGEARGHKVLEKLHLGKNRTHALVADRYSAMVSEAVRNQRKQIDIALRADRRIRGAGFDYDYKVFQQSAGKRILKMFEELPKGLERLNAVDKEVVVPEAKGVEGYAPQHDYELSGHGEIATISALTALVAFRERLLKRDWFDVKPIRLFTG